MCVCVCTAMRKFTIGPSGKNPVNFRVSSPSVRIRVDKYLHMVCSPDESGHFTLRVCDWIDG